MLVFIFSSTGHMSEVHTELLRDRSGPENSEQQDLAVELYVNAPAAGRLRGSPQVD